LTIADRERNCCSEINVTRRIKRIMDYIDNQFLIVSFISSLNFVNKIFVNLKIFCYFDAKFLSLSNLFHDLHDAKDSDLAA